MKENIATKSLGANNNRVMRAFGQEAHVLVSSEQTGDAFCVLRFFAPPGNVTPAHVHHSTDETFLIESGQGEINRGGGGAPCAKGRRHLSPQRNSPCAKGDWERRDRGGRGVRAGRF